MRNLAVFFGIALTLIALTGCSRSGHSDRHDAELLSEWRYQSDAEPALSVGHDTEALEANVPSFINTFEVTVATSNVKNASTNAHIWLVVSVHVTDSGQTDSSIVFLGTGADQGSTKTFSASGVRGDFNQERAGALTLINGMNGENADWSVDRVRVVGTDYKGKKWQIADYTIPPAQAYRRWLRNDPSVKAQGPALPIPTTGNWQPLN